MNKHFDPRDEAEREFMRRLDRHMEHSQKQRRPLTGHDGMKKLTDFPEWSDSDDLYEDAFWYTFNQLGNIAPAGIATQNIQIQGDSKFEWMKTSVFAVFHGGVAPSQTTDKALLNIFISDTGSGRNLMNAPLALESIAGNGKEPYVLPVTRIFQPNATVQCSVSSFDPAATWDFVQVQMHGRKVFRGRQGA